MAFTLSVCISAEPPLLQDSTVSTLASIVFVSIKMDTFLKIPSPVPKSHLMSWELSNSHGRVQVKLAIVFKLTVTTGLSSLNSGLVATGAPAKWKYHDT